MKDFRFNYIITIHNKQDLIEQVLKGVFAACRENSYVYPVLDGCTDDTENIIDRLAKEYPHISLQKIYAPDVHEIRSINIALKTVPMEGRGTNIILQDDVVLKDPELEEKITRVYDYYGYENVGTLVFRHGVNIALNHETKKIEERELIESAFSIGMCADPLLPGMAVKRMVGVRSPEAISFSVVKEIGVMDEALAPYTYDNHDLSLRCLIAGRVNIVFALAFESELKWGGTRTNPHPEYGRVINRNAGYLYEKHKEFLQKFTQTKLFQQYTFALPEKVPGCGYNINSIQPVVRRYFKLRKQLVGLRVYVISQYLKLPIKKILYWFLRQHNLNPSVRKVTYKLQLLFSQPKTFFKIAKDIVRLRLVNALAKENKRFSTDVEVALLKRYAQGARQGIVEIGVLDGGTTREMATVATAPIYGIDPIIPDSMNKQLVGSEEKIRTNMEFYPKFHFYKDFSYNVVKTWQHAFDFIFIDGDHEYGAVRQDFEDWVSRIAQGGYIAFHDSAPVTSIPGAFEGWEGPIRLVKELKRDPRVVFVETQDSISVFRKV